MEICIKMSINFSILILNFHEALMKILINKFIFSMLSLIPLGCSAAAPPPIYADRCYLIEGSRDRYLEVDTLARKIASNDSLISEGSNSSALVIKEQNGGNKVVISSPFGKDASIISLYKFNEKNSKSEIFFEKLIADLRLKGFKAVECSSVPGLKTPSLQWEPR